MAGGNQGVSTRFLVSRSKISAPKRTSANFGFDALADESLRAARKGARRMGPIVVAAGRDGLVALVHPDRSGAAGRDPPSDRSVTGLASMSIS